MIPEPTEAMLPCPFCGQQPEMEPWHGGAPTKVMITCVGLHPEAGFIDCGPAPSVTGETPAGAIAAWNTREPEAGKLRDALEECATALNSFIYIIAQRFDGDGSYYWMRGPTHDEAQAAMEANNNALAALSRNQGR